MAKQASGVPLRGQIGGIIFYKTADGYLAKGESSLDKKRVLTDPAFERSRWASGAFGYAAKCGSLLRTSMAYAKKLGETRLTGRFNKIMYAILKTDSSTERLDEKRIHRGDMNKLRGVAWHSDKPLSGVLKAGYSVDIDGNSDAVILRITSFVPKKGLDAPVTATHFELFGCAAALDFEQIKATKTFASSGVRAINGSNTGSIELDCSVDSGEGLPVVAGLGVMFYQEVGGEMKVLLDKGCFEIVGVRG